MTTKKTVFMIVAASILCCGFLSAQADLVVQKISIEPEKPVPGDIVKITAIITNPTLNNFDGKLKITLFLDDKAVLEQEENGFPSQAVKTYTIDTAPAAGDHTIKVVIDTGSEMELNSLNNIDDLYFSVLTETERQTREDEIAKKDLPDLVCEEMIRPSKADMIPDNAVIFYAVFTLYGKEKIAGPMAAEWMMDEKSLAKINLKNFPPDIKWKFGMKWAAKVGRHSLKASIDSENVINEKIENNNTCELTFSVHPKTPEFEDQSPENRVRRLSYQPNLDIPIKEPIYIEEVLIEPVNIEGEIGQSRITYVVHNTSSKEYRNIQITAYETAIFAHSFFIESLKAGERYEIFFVDKVSKGEIKFSIQIDQSSWDQQGLLIFKEVK